MYYQQANRIWNCKHTENLGATKMCRVDKSACLVKTGLRWKFFTSRLDFL